MLFRLAFKTTINQLSNTIYSEDFLQSAEKAGEMKELVTNIMKEVGRPNLADCFPVLKMIDPHGIRRRTGSYFLKLLNIFKSLIHKRLELRKDAAGYCTKKDMLDAMLNNAQHKMDIVKIQRLSLVFPFPELKLSYMFNNTYFLVFLVLLSLVSFLPAEENIECLCICFNLRNIRRKLLHTGHSW